MATMPTNPIIVIPARLASTRLPGKPLADIHGEPMIVHVWRRGIEAGIGPVVVACAEPEIADAITKAGGQAVLTNYHGRDVLYYHYVNTIQNPLYLDELKFLGWNYINYIQGWPVLSYD